MDSPRRSTTNRSRSILITTRKASASSLSQVWTRRYPPYAPQRYVRRRPTRPTATRLIDHATNRDPDDITTLPVGLRDEFSLSSSPIRSSGGPPDRLPVDIATSSFTDSRPSQSFPSSPICVFLFFFLFVSACFSATIGAICFLVICYTVYTDDDAMMTAPVEFYCLRDIDACCILY